MASLPPELSLWQRVTGRVRAWLGLDPLPPAPSAGRRDGFDPAPPWPDPDGPQVPLQVTVHEAPDRISLEVPARGDGYPFLVHVRCDWYGQATILDEALRAGTERRLRERISRLRAGIEERVDNEVRPVARQHDPHQAAELEAALGRHLAGCFDEGQVQCTARVRVDVCQPVREMLAKTSDALIRLDAHGRYEMARIAQLRVLRRHWEELFLDALRGAGDVDAARATWLAPYALKLAEAPKDATRQLERMLEERQRHATQLFNDIGSVIETNQRGELDHVSFMMSSDHIFRQMLIHLGLPVPPKNDGAAASTTSQNG